MFNCIGPVLQVVDFNLLIYIIGIIISNRIVFKNRALVACDIVSGFLNLGFKIKNSFENPFYLKKP